MDELRGKVCATCKCQSVRMLETPRVYSLKESASNEKFDIIRMLPSPADQNRVARDWWRDDDARVLPGEESGTTVFVVEFQDGCQFFGYTHRSVFVRLGELMGGPLDRGSNDFVREHGRAMAYVVQCVRSSLDRSSARQLRDQLVSQAPGDVYVSDGATATTSHCGLREGETEAEVMSFGEWVKEFETQACGEGTEITLP